MVAEAKTLPIVQQVDFGYIEENFKEHFPNYVTLMYVDYRDNLDDAQKEVMEAIEKNDLNDLELTVLDDWYLDCRWRSEDEYWNDFKDEVLEELENMQDDLDEPYGEEADNIDRIREYMEDDGLGGCRESFREWLNEHDGSGDVLQQLIDNSSEPGMFYDLNQWFGETWCWDADAYGEAIREICEALSLDYHSKPVRDQLHELLANATGGGCLRIYFNAPLSDMISGDRNGCKYGRVEDDHTDFKSIKFDGSYMVTVYNPYEGSGYWVEMRLNCSLQFNRENLRVSMSEHYPLEKCFGTYSDYKCSSVIFSFGAAEKEVEVNSSLKAEADRQAEYERVFKAGGCTYGDMDIRRHRNTYYLNEIPCGTHCPHCGTFWID